MTIRASAIQVRCGGRRLVGSVSPWLVVCAALVVGAPAGAQDFALPDDFPAPPEDAGAAPAATVPAVPAETAPVPGPSVGPDAAVTATPATPEAAPATPEAAALATAPGTADEAFDLRAKQIEEQVNDLKEKIFRTKERLMQLNEVILGRGDITSGAKLALSHRNELGSSYELVGAAYTLDGVPVFTKVEESGELNELEEIPLFNQRVVPGQHRIAVQYELRGNGYGVFAYLEGIRLKVTGSYQFDVEPGKITTISAIVHEKDGITLEFKDKPTVRFTKNVEKELGKQEPNADAGGAGAPVAATPGAGQ